MGRLVAAITLLVIIIVLVITAVTAAAGTIASFLYGDYVNAIVWLVVFLFGPRLLGTVFLLPVWVVVQAVYGD